MSLVTDLRRTLLERISALCAPHGVDNVAVQSGALTPLAVQDLATRLPAVRLALTGIQQIPALYFDPGNFQTRWVVYLMVDGTTTGDATLMNLLESLLEEFPNEVAANGTTTVQIEALMARNLSSSTLNTTGLPLWMVSFNAGLRLGDDPAPALENGYEF